MAASSSYITSDIPTSGSLQNPDELHAVPVKNKSSKSLPSQLGDQPLTPHDIFLSHSGAQKGFVKDLYDELRRLSFNTFFDTTHHSLPLAECFPKKIFSAAKNCKLAVVVLSEEFLSSKWPMIELSIFVKSGIKILPLFFKLLPEDLKNDINRKRWGEAWEGYAQDTRIKLTEWENAIKAICSYNGLTLKDPSVEGERTYLHRVVSGICEIVPREIKFAGPHIHGMNELCQIILDRFEKMESLGKVNVLGLYGLPGSGKSTLCKCLCDHFFPIYGGRSLYLELPTKATTDNLVHKFKDLLHLIGFQDRFSLDPVSDLGQLFNLLESFQLRRCRVFLVIDNISDDSWEAVQMFLPLVLGPGSKVILVARTSKILWPILDFLKIKSEQHYTRNHIMEIPSIQETDAIQILLQTSGVGTVPSMDGHAVQHINLTATQRETILRIVRMCNFGRSEDRPQYLPLVMKMMGAMLITYEGDFARWGHDLQNFWGKVKTCKEKALKQLVEKSFKALPDEELQLLFLDLSLFILPLNLCSLEEVFVLLSNIYDGHSVADIELMIKDLERHSFLTTDDGSDIIRFHDVYLEFAETISEDPSRFNRSIRYYWRNYKYEGAKDGKVLSFKEVEAEGFKRTRTMILEMQGDGYERVELQGLLSLKALVLRNCQSLKVLRLEGLLSSLASLEILNCPNLRHIDGNSDLCNVKRLIISSREGTIQAGDKEGMQAFNVRAFLARFCKWLHTAPQPSSLEMGFAKNMRGLQVLRLENTGIRRLQMDMGSCWPQLQNLIVREYSLEAFEVGNLPNLKCFYFNDNTFVCYAGERWKNGVPMQDDYRRTPVWESKNKDKSRFMLQGKSLLEGCPQLEHVQIRSAFFEEGKLGPALPPNMVFFELDSVYPARMLPDLSPSAHTLEQVCLHWCKKLEKISFLVEFGKLTHLVVAECHSLVELTGLNFLFSLRELYVQSCSNLRVIIGPFDNFKMLETFYVEKCPKLRGLSGADLENLSSLKHLHFPLKCADRHRRFKLKNLENLCILAVTSLQIIDGESDCSTSTNMQQQLGGMLEGLEDLVNLKTLELHGEASSNHKLHERTEPALSLSFSSLVGLDEHHIAQRLPSTSDFSSGKCLKSLELKNLSDLASMDGLGGQCFLNLDCLKLHCLENLRSLQELESLVHLRILSLRYCPVLEELPSLNTLVNLCELFIHHCTKLKAVEGADAAVESGVLWRASFEGCESLVHLPFSVTALRERQSLRKRFEFSLEFKDCKFAGTEAMMAWVVNKDLPSSLRATSFKNLHDQYRRDDSGSLRQVIWFDALFPILLNRLVPNDNQCLHFDYLAKEISSRLLTLRVKPKPSATVRELQERVGGIAKKDVVQTFQAHPECKLLMLRLLDELGFSKCEISPWV